MIYLQHITNGTLVASTTYPKRNKEDYREITKEEYEKLMAELATAAEEQEVTE